MLVLRRRVQEHAAEDVAKVEVLRTRGRPEWEGRGDGRAIAYHRSSGADGRKRTGPGKRERDSGQPWNRAKRKAIATRHREHLRCRSHPKWAVPINLRPTYEEVLKDHWPRPADRCEVAVS